MAVDLRRAGPGERTEVGGAQRARLDRVLLGAVLLVGLVLREAASKLLSSPVDESASLLATEAAATRGLPILPSDVPYLQGATLSYLLAPLHWVGLDGIDHLFLMRQLSVVAGVAAIALTYVVVRRLTTGPWFALVAALLLALDPRSVAWGSAVRMYSLLQLLTIALVWAGLHLVERQTVRAVVLTVVLGWLAVYTTVLGSLLFPGVVVGCGIVLVRTPVGRRLLVGLTAGLALAPASFLVLNHVLSRSVGVSGSGSKVQAGFVGDHLISKTPDWTPPFSIWLDPWPGVVVAVASVVLLAGWLARGREGTPRVLLVGCYWVPVLAMLVFGRGLVPRYFVNVHPLWVAMLVLACADLLPRREPRAATVRPPAFAAAAVFAALALTSSGWTIGRGLHTLDTTRLRGIDLLNASRYVADHHRPGEAVLVSLPPPTYLALGSADDIVFMPGRANSERTALYTRRTDHGLEDFWLGVPVATSGPQVCTRLAASPQGWVIADVSRLSTTNGYQGAMAEAMLGLTTRVGTWPGGVLVLRARPDAAALAETLPACHP